MEEEQGDEEERGGEEEEQGDDEEGGEGKEEASLMLCHACHEKDRDKGKERIEKRREERRRKGWDEQSILESMRWRGTGRGGIYFKREEGGDRGGDGDGGRK